MVQDQACVFLLRVGDGIQRDLRPGRGLIGIVNPGKTFHTPLTRLNIQSLGISLFADLYGSIDIDLDEAAFFHHTAHLIAGSPIGTDCRAHDNAAMTHDFRCYEANSLYVQVTVLFAESQSFRQMSANHVTIEHCNAAALLKDQPFQRLGSRGLPGDTQPGKPDTCSLTLSLLRSQRLHISHSP